MKKFSILLSMLLILAVNAYSQVSINADGSNADGSAMLDVKSTNKGFLPPRMTEAQRDAISNPVAGLQIFNSTTNQPNYFNGTVWMSFDGTSAETLTVGDYYQGGIIFYLNDSGGGLICTVSDQSPGTEWGCKGIEISGADGIVIGTGAQNTIDIEAGCATAGTAAHLCAYLTLNGYSDWFLPSEDELNEMYKNKTIIDATAIANGGSAFSTYYYWCSTEEDLNRAKVQYFDTGFKAVLDKDNPSVRVRAVRAF